MAPNSNYLVWMDLEMTGLDPEVDTIIEIATVITNSNLDIVAEGPALAIHHPEERLLAMDDWNTQHHSESGLWDRVLESKITLAQAERQTLDFIREHVGVKESPLCGNSIHQDRRFLRKYMSALENYLHYRNVDVSSIKELVKRWYPGTLPPRKNASHLALEDVFESIDELRFYRENIFRP